MYLKGKLKTCVQNEKEKLELKENEATYSQLFRKDSKHFENACCKA